MSGGGPFGNVIGGYEQGNPLKPWLALCTVSVATVPMSIGAGLGDVLPGSQTV